MGRFSRLIIGVILFSGGILGLLFLHGGGGPVTMNRGMEDMMGGMMGRGGMMGEMMRNMGEIEKKTTFSSIGERIYYRGADSKGVAIKNSHGMQGVGCAMCHGADARGMRMMMMDVPSLRWKDLTDPKGHVHPTGRSHPPFTESSFSVCVLAGNDPAGNTLNTMMPRWEMSEENIKELITFLKTK